MPGRCQTRRGGGGGHGDGCAQPSSARTAELVRTAHVVSSQQKAVLRVVRNLAGFNGVVIVLLVAYAWFLKLPLDEIISACPDRRARIDPVALPANIHPCGGARRSGASKDRRFFRPASRRWMKRETTDVLCADKTGTLTQNALTVTSVHAMPGLTNRMFWRWPAGEFRWRPGSGRRSHSRGRRVQGDFRRAET